MCTYVVIVTWVVNVHSTIAYNVSAAHEEEFCTSPMLLRNDNFLLAEQNDDMFTWPPLLM